MSTRSASVNLLQAQGAHARRATASVPPFCFGTVASYNPATHKAVVTIDNGNGFAYDTPPSPICSPFWGQGYGSQGGPPIGCQALVAVVSAEGNLFAILGFTPNDIDPGIGAPSDENWIVDKRGSFVKWVAQRGGMIRVFGAAIASIFGGTRTEVGGENLDTTNQAAIRKSDLDASNALLVAHLQAQITAWAGASLSGGIGAGGPTLTPTTSTGSTKVTIA